MRRGIGLIIALLLAPFAVGDAATLPRVMSTNLCADALLLDLAAPEQIVSLFWQSSDPRYSSRVAAASAYPRNHASAEEVIAAAPDLLLTSRRWLARYSPSLLARHGIEAISVPYPTDWEVIFNGLLTVGAAIGREDIARDKVRDVQQRLQRIAQSREQDGHARTALYLRPNGGSAGAGTPIDAVIRAAGLDNHAGALGLNGWGRVSLESVVMQPPEQWLLGGMQRDHSHARGAFGRHPVLQNLQGPQSTLRLQHSDQICAQWRLIDVAEALVAQERERDARQADVTDNAEVQTP